MPYALEPIAVDLKPAAKKDKPAKVDQFKTYPCKICKRSFKKAGNLARHQADVHDNTTEIGTHKSESSD